MHEVYVPEDARLGNVEFFGPPVPRRIAKTQDLKQLPGGSEATQEKS